MMKLDARDFECFPRDSLAFRQLGDLISRIDVVSFSISAGARNSNQLTSDFDVRLKEKILTLGARENNLVLNDKIGKRADFTFAINGECVSVEVEKADWQKILYDLLKFHIYLKNGADFTLLFIPKLYPHSNGEHENFKVGCERYEQCLEFGFGSKENFDRILLVGYEQITPDAQRFTSAVRNRLKTERKSALAQTVTHN